MKTLITTLALTLLTFSAARADESWLTDYDKAVALAKKENKVILADFNGSDWCPPCKALKKGVFETAEFKKYAKDNLVLLDVDFPKGKKQDAALAKHNEQLSEKFKIEGFPTVLLINAAGKVLMTEVGYDDETPADYINKIKKAKGK
jgi:thioredoxin-related protein